MSPPSPDEMVLALATHERSGEWIAALRAGLFDVESPERAAAVERGLGESAVSDGDHDTAWGNIRTLLVAGARTVEARQVLAALAAIAARGDMPSAPETERARARDLLALTAHHRVDALAMADAALGPAAGALWAALTELVPQLPPSEALVALVALRRSTHLEARAALASLQAKLDDPLVVAMFGPSSATGALQGELLSAPPGPVAHVLLTITGISFLLGVGRAFCRFALAYRRPAELKLSERGLEVSSHTELLGKVLRRHALVVPLSNLAQISREVRFARAGLFAGLFALALGTYVGMGLVVDGARVPGTSPSLLGIGLLIILLGIGLDFGLSFLANGARGRCQIVVQPRKGRRLCVGRLEPSAADAMLLAVAKAS
ncbi:MAG: hypothetical protein KF718_18695 [Polyangiaceae bacterium]|nr:hypothetical protein [Polyangiaceae bacterium]